MYFYVINKKYINDLKTIDNKVGDVEYGTDKLKFHLGVVLNINNLNYYVPVSSPRPKHLKMKDGIDFIKIYHFSTNRLLCVLNLNNMIPVPSEFVELLEYSNIENYRTFKDIKEKNDYIFLLKDELNSINFKETKILQKAQKLYEAVKNNPDSRIANRCCDFIELEKFYLLYK